MDPELMVYALVAAMLASGGVLGAFWVRALTIMRRRMLDADEELRQLASRMHQLEGQNAELSGRIDAAERLLGDGAGSESVDLEGTK